jgi:acyl-[acyl carrier protein]--UDP-N-acetylglucosamine O-acyltransferase
VRVGRLAIIAGGEALAKDVMPFGAVFRDRHKGYNAVGCRRAGMGSADVHALRGVFQRIHTAPSAVLAARQIRGEGGNELAGVVRELLEFIESSRRGIQPSAKGGEEDGAGGEMAEDSHKRRVHAGDRWGKEKAMG